MIITISGAHRSGKTTLAQELATELDIEFIRTNISSVTKNLDFDFTKPTSEKNRVDIQRKIMEYLDDLEIPINCVLDRWYSDFLMYLMANIEVGSSNLDTMNLISELKSRIEYNENIVSIVISPSKHITANHDPNKQGEWFNSNLYRTQLDTIVLGLNANNKSIIVPPHIHPNDRLGYLLGEHGNRFIKSKI